VYNEEKVIRLKIENLLALDYPADRLEIWVGSDCSTDATHDIVRGFKSDRVHLWTAARRGGKTEVLNHLAPLIDAEVILFTDANTMHRPDSLRKLVRSFADPTVGGVAGSIKHRSGKQEKEEQLYRSFESKQKFFESRLHSSISAFGGFYSIRSSLFRPLHYNAYSNDDVLIPMNIIRLQHRVVFDPEAVSEEDMTESIAHEFARRIRIGAGNFQAFFWLLDFLHPGRGWPWFCYFSHKVTRWFSPFLLGTAFVCSGILWFLTSATVFLAVPLAGVLFIATGLSFLVIPVRITRPAFYFLSMNTALVLGLLRYCKGIQSAAWTRTERDTERLNNR
jgi:cellulose synthase/poly-beta-1,6-N-acetylglucosamine synthase-like glycosyltransferase